MNQILLGVVRHGIQFGAGAAGVAALSKGDGLDLAVAVAVSVVNLGSFLVQAYLARKSA